MEQNILELIPINHEYVDTAKSPVAHLARLRELTLKGQKVNKIIYLIFHEEKDNKVIELLKGMHQFLFQGEPDEFQLSLKYPEIVRNVRKLRCHLETSYEGWYIYLNLTPLRYHFHSIILRDGLKSHSYELFPYEIYDLDYRSFNYSIIPDYRELDLVDYEIMELFFENKNNPMTLKEFLNKLEAPSWNKKISTYDQKIRNRLNLLVDKGLLDYTRGLNGEKFYKLKYFRLDNT